MKNFRWTILAALLVTTSGVAHAQSPAPTGSGSSFRGPSSSMSSSSMSSSSGPSGSASTTVNGASEDSGNISNIDLGSNMTMPARGNSSPGISNDEFSSTTTTDTLSSVTSETTLANTGGEPVLMSLVGMVIATGAFLVRRRVTN